MQNVLKLAMQRIANAAGFAIVRKDTLSRLTNTTRCAPQNLAINSVGSARPLVVIDRSAELDRIPFDHGPWLDAILSSRAYSETILPFFLQYPGKSFISAESRAILFSLVRIMKPRLVAEIGTLFAGTTETLARALWENGSGIVHTCDPFAPGRAQGRILTWPRALQAITRFHPVNSMGFMLELRNLRAPLDLVFVDGSHDYEFALFDLLTAAKTIRPGGVIIMDNADQSGVFQACLSFLRQHPEWAEIGTSLQNYDYSRPFHSQRPSVVNTSFVIFQAPDAIVVQSIPRSFGPKIVSGPGVTGFSIECAQRECTGTLHYQAILRAIGDNASEIEEFKTLESAVIEVLPNHFRHQIIFPKRLTSSMADRFGDAIFTFEIELAWDPAQDFGPLELKSDPVYIK